jgi:hypothetical protein
MMEDWNDAMMGHPWARLVSWPALRMPKLPLNEPPCVVRGASHVTRRLWMRGDALWKMTNGSLRGVDGTYAAAFSEGIVRGKDDELPRKNAGGDGDVAFAFNGAALHRAPRGGGAVT